jgi:hypothetical protein
MASGLVTTNRAASRWYGAGTHGCATIEEEPCDVADCFFCGVERLDDIAQPLQESVYVLLKRPRLLAGALEFDEERGPAGDQQHPVGVPTPAAEVQLDDLLRLEAEASESADERALDRGLQVPDHGYSSTERRRLFPAQVTGRASAQSM